MVRPAGRKVSEKARKQGSGGSQTAARTLSTSELLSCHRAAFVLRLSSRSRRDSRLSPSPAFLLSHDDSGWAGLSQASPSRSPQAPQEAARSPGGTHIHRSGRSWLPQLQPRADAPQKDPQGSKELKNVGCGVFSQKV